MDLKKISDYEWKIEKSGKMKVPAIIYASEKLLNKIKEDNTLEQIKNVAFLPGIIKAAYAMPDAHQGYGFPIGGVAAFDIDSGIISPGGVGYDINCSVRLLRTNLKKEHIEKKKKEVVEALFRSVPSGVGSGGKFKMDRKTIKEVLEQGAQWAVKNGYGKKEDYEKTEDEGRLKDADVSCVSDKAISRGMPQLGSLGAGNHFLEVQYVDEIFDSKIAKVFGIEKGQTTIMIHCGSRGLGHQVASDYIREMEHKYGFANLPDRELVNAPIKSELGQKYYKAMCAAANFAFANKQMITHWIRETMSRIFPEFKAEVVYDVCHNIAKFEKHIVGGKEKEVLVMRKGATRSFGPGRKEIPKDYKEVGQPVIIPGSMGTSSYLLVGTKKAEEISFGSTAHGAGRVASRASARNVLGESVVSALNKKGIEVKSGSWKGLAEEAPEMYKDIDEVVRVSHGVGIGKLVARVKPMTVMKG
ncbi:RNA-splicing ligase RtcB [Candidatus Woesearchaeota archaeon CG10_big_fil_rev_8_21_14_0_10_34_12]|nr:MAG: RNA-splicing ligase RtcB [Candidatus Woesearchaeota archaeon CG10_big_fil_rev_8_21_14_0_10_34_12]